MPELPEVETVRRLIERAFLGKRVAEAEVVADEIVLGGAPADLVRGSVEGRMVTGVGRKGKYWWVEFEERPWLFGHLGMAGWVREVGEHTIRLREHGEAPLDDETGRPRFLKLRLRSEDGREVVMTDGRRLARLWLGQGPDSDTRVLALGPDAWTDLPSAKDIFGILQRRKAPMKALLLDQKLFAGVGNWIADEALYQAGISPQRLGCELSFEEVGLLREKLWLIIDLAVEVGADSGRYPEGWMFHYRWGGSKGEEAIGGHQIRRDQVGGRTTAWVPALQR